MVIQRNGYARLRTYKLKPYSRNTHTEREREREERRRKREAERTVEVTNCVYLNYFYGERWK